MINKHLEEFIIYFLEVVFYSFILNFKERNKYKEFPIKHHIDLWQNDLIDIINCWIDQIICEKDKK